MPQLHPSLRPPAQELDFVRLEVRVFTTAVVPSYSSTRSLTIRLRRRKSTVIGVPGYGVGCWMYGQST